MMVKNLSLTATYESIIDHNFLGSPKSPARLVFGMKFTFQVKWTFSGFEFEIGKIVSGNFHVINCIE